MAWFLLDPGHLDRDVKAMTLDLRLPHRPGPFAGWLAALCMAAASMPAFGAQHITGIDIEPRQAVIQLDGKVRYRWFRLPDPERLVIDLRDTALERKRLRVPVGVGPVVGVRSAARNRHDRRVVFDLHRRLDARVTQEPDGTGGWRIVVDFGGEPQAPAVPRTRKRSQAAVCPSPRIGDQFLVVLDAGHGGRDRGATGAHGWREKDLVLAITHRLHRLVSQSPFMHSVLTREGDEFIDLEARYRLAEACGADLLLSIHADSLPGTEVRGASVYVHRRARNTARRLLAASRVPESYVTPASLAASAAVAGSPRAAGDLVSYDAARLILSELRQVGPLVRRSVLGQRFVVLSSTSVPSVLVETGYLSHGEEEMALADPEHQQRLAEALYRALVRHAEQSRGLRPGGERVHIVGRRTSVPNLAGRMGIDVEVLRRGMGSPGNVLSSGDVVRIPAGFDHS